MASATPMPKEADLLIRGCGILTLSQQGFITQGAIAVKDGRITYVGKEGAVPKLRVENVIEAEGKVAMPGFVNCHTHVAMTLFRGIAEDKPLGAWLRDTIWPLERKLTREDVYWGALLGCLEMIKSGTTCFADMYFHEDAVAEAVEKAGLRAVLSQGIIEGAAELGMKTFNQALSFVEKHHEGAEERIKAWLGPHAVYTCSEQLLRRVRRAASEKGVRIHIHLAESLEHAEKIQKNRGLTEVELLEKIGFLGPDVLAAHCIYLTEKDMRLLKKHGVKVAYNAVANAKLGLDISPVEEMKELGICVGLGTDGPASNNSLDMFETMKFACLLQKIRYRDATVMKTREAVEMATLGGAKALGLENDVGSLEPGKRADIILVDFRKPHLKPFRNVYANLVYASSGSDVDTVIVDGKILMEQRQVKVLDENKIMEKTEEKAFRLLRRNG